MGTETSPVAAVHHLGKPNADDLVDSTDRVRSAHGPGQHPAVPGGFAPRHSAKPRRRRRPTFSPRASAFLHPGLGGPRVFRRRLSDAPGRRGVNPGAPEEKPCSRAPPRGVPVPPARQRRRQQRRHTSAGAGWPLAGPLLGAVPGRSSGSRRRSTASRRDAGQRHGAGRGQDVLGPGAAPAPQDAGKVHGGSGPSSGSFMPRCLDVRSSPDPQLLPRGPRSRCAVVELEGCGLLACASVPCSRS